jgi:hypothetical protein
VFRALHVAIDEQSQPILDCRISLHTSRVHVNLFRIRKEYVGLCESGNLVEVPQYVGAHADRVALHEEIGIDVDECGSL